jgi:two-component system chemotaxis sensor kinase CheA
MLGIHSRLLEPNDHFMKPALQLGLGKYRDLLFAILLFIVLDVGILLFNFYASIQLDRDAARIGAAGELRMLTQQITKSVLTLQVERKAELPVQTSLAQLEQGNGGFNRSLAALKDSLGRNIEFTLFGLDPEVLREAVKKVEREWRPLEETLAPLLASQAPALEDVDIAVNKAVARNIRLSGLSDDVTTVVERAARAKTDRMRQIQVAAIVLALLNFVYIVFKFLRRLHASDRVAEAARRDTEDILNTVSEGLLLVRSDGTVGGQFSASVRQLFMRPVQPGADFVRLLGDMLDPARAQEASHFVQLLFDPKVKPALLQQLDPLRDVEVSAPADAAEGSRFLTFQFTQVREGNAVKELLVTVFDVTQRVRLERQLADSQEAARGSVDDLIRVLENEPALLQDFLLEARDKLAGLNDGLREAGRKPRDYQRLVEQAAQVVHGIKGEAGALSLAAVGRQAHLMEDALAPLRQRRDIAGEDLIPVVFELSRLQEQVERLHRVFHRFASSEAGQAGPGQQVDGMVRNLQSLSERVAQSLSKQVRLTAHVQEAQLPPEVTQVLRETLPQLVRNAVVHGIESPEERQSLGKPAVGELRLEIRRQADGRIEVVLSDDGRGISVAQVRERAAALREDAQRMSDTQILGFIFDANFSTAHEVTEHAGRGDGLALVRQLVERTGAKLRVMTQPSAYTRFILQFGVPA